MSRSRIMPLGLPRQLLDELNKGQSSGAKRHSKNLAAERKKQRRQERSSRKISVPARSSVAGSRSVGKYSQRDRAKEQPSAPAFTPEENDTESTKTQESEERDYITEARQNSSAFSLTDAKPRANRALRDRLAEDDAQIAALERRLGKKSSKTLDRGLEGLLGEIGNLGGLSDTELDKSSEAPSKRSLDTEDDEWLRSKRQKTGRSDLNAPQPIYEDESDDFEGFSSSDSTGEVTELQRLRENPYVPPSNAKYVPPSLKGRLADIPSESRDLNLRRKLQGILNKLSESNMLNLLQEIQQISQQYARNEVFGTLNDLLLSILSDSAALNDTFMILHAALTAGLYRMMGTGFIAKLVQELVERIDQRPSNRNSTNSGKERSNLISFLSELYNYQVISSSLIYDLIRTLTNEFSEASAELLLRIVRISGQKLRQDDPASLSDVVMLLQQSLKGKDQANISVRARFMVESITDLKNNRLKAGIQATTIRTEHYLRMKKILASSSASKIFSARMPEPLRINLTDIRQRDLKGHWWLVGAAYRDEAQIRQREAGNSALTSNQHAAVCDRPKQKLTGDAARPEPVVHDIASVARSLGMNTDVRRALFASVMTSTSLDDAYARVLKLALRKKQVGEVAIVLARCAAAEQSHNPFHAALAQKLSGQREVRKTLWNPLLEVLAWLDQDQDQDQEDVDQASSWYSGPQAQYNLTQFFGSLIAEGVIGLGVLKSRNLIGSQGISRTFLELLILKVLASIGKNRNRLEQVFAPALSSDSLSFARSMLMFVETRIMKSDLVEPRNSKATAWSSNILINLLQNAS